MIIEIRKHMHGAWILALAMFFSFAIPPLVNFVKLMRMRADAVAVVNGISLTDRKFREAAFAYEAYLRSLRMMGLEKYIRHLGKMDILESCIAELLKKDMADSFGVEVHDKELANRLAKEIGQRYIADGVFDKEKYSAQILASTGMKMSQYEERIRETVAAESLDDIVRICSPELFLGKKNDAAKKLSIIKLKKSTIADILKKSGVDQEELKAFYANNSSNYLSPEERTFDSLFLDYQLFKDHVLITEDEIFEYYQNTVSTSFTKSAKHGVEVWETSTEGLSEEEVAKKLDHMSQMQASLVEKGILTLSKNTMKDISVYSKEMDEVSKMGLDPILAAAVAEQDKEGAITPVLKGEKSIFFAQVKKYSQPQVVPLEEAKEAILPILESRALTILARQEVEELIKEARENENGEQLLAREADKLGLKIQRVSCSSDSEDEGVDPVFKKSAEVQVGLVGCSPKESGVMIYTLTSFKPREALPFEEVVSDVQKDYLTAEANKKAQVVAAEIKKSILAGDEYQAALSEWKGSAHKTDWLKHGEKADGLEAFEIRKALKMSQVGAEVLVFDDADVVKVITLAEVKDQAVAPADADPLIYDSKRDYNFAEGVYASDQRSAQIKYYTQADRRVDLEEI